MAGSMWVFVAFYGLLGAAGAVVPSVERGFVHWFTRPGRVRILGAVLLVAGLYLFLAADKTHLPVFVLAAGIAHVLVGGVNLLLPEPMVVFNEAYLARGNGVHRLAAVAYLLVAALFAAAALAASGPGDALARLLA